MNEDTGEIRDFKNVPGELVKSNEESPVPKVDRAWSDAFYKGEIVTLKGIEMKIVKIKQMRGQIILEAKGI
jgi:hypothetical protein